MQRANKWRIRDEEEYIIALTYLRRSFSKSLSFWEDCDNKEIALQELEPFSDILPVDDTLFEKLNGWIYKHLNHPTTKDFKKILVAVKEL